MNVTAKKRKTIETLKLYKYSKNKTNIIYNLFDYSKSVGIAE